MAITGPAPKDGKRRRNPDTFQWVEVADAPSSGPSMDLPDEITSSLVHDWYGAIRRMPHCVLWQESDWIFAVTTAFVAAECYSGQGSTSSFSELRQREAKMGVTVEDRMKLRIRYVRPEVGQGSEAKAETPKRRLKAVDPSAVAGA
jgi:hypothetical protein